VSASSKFFRHWVAAHAVGLLVAMAAFAVVADNPLMPESEPGELVGHLAGFLAFAAVFAYFQRGALAATTGRPVRTPMTLWVVGTAVAVWLGYGLSYEVIGPPVDFAAALVIVGASSGLLLMRELPVGSRWLMARGALAGVAGVVGMVPAVVLAGPLDDLLGGGLAPFVVAVMLIGLAGGACVGAVLRPRSARPALV